MVIALTPNGPTFGADWGDDGTSAGSILFWAAQSPCGVWLRGEPVDIGVTDGFHPQMLPHGRFFYTSGQRPPYSAPLTIPQRRLRS